VTPEQDHLLRVLTIRDVLSRTYRLPETKYVSGTWYLQGPWPGYPHINGSEIRRACKADGQPYVINHNWIVGNDAKISRAKRWGHWFLQNEAKGTCHNRSLLREKIADMHATMEFLTPLYDEHELPRPVDSAGSLRFVSSIVYCICWTVAFFILGRRLAIPRRYEAVLLSVFFLLALHLDGLLDAELGDMHADVRRRRRYGISVYLTGQKDTGRYTIKDMIRFVSWIPILLIGWRFGLHVEVRKRLPARYFLWRERTGFLRCYRNRAATLILVTCLACLFTSSFDAEIGDKHSDLRRRNPVGLSFYITIPDYLTQIGAKTTNDTVWLP